MSPPSLPYITTLNNEIVSFSISNKNRRFYEVYKSDLPFLVKWMYILQYFIIQEQDLSRVLSVRYQVKMV